MELHFNVTGEQRKALVHAIGEITHTAPVYKASSKRIFQIGDMKVDKDGVLYYTEQTEIEALIAALAERGFLCEPKDGVLLQIKEQSALCIEMPLEGFTDTTLGNLERLIAAKATLIKNAISAETLPVERTETTLRFPWFCADASPEEVQAYAVFIERLCTAAKTQKCVTAVERSVENEKYAFRCFLLKLGFIGDEYKTARKVLLARLEGDGAWRTK